MSSRWVAVIAAYICLVWSGRAEANLCNPQGNETNRAKDEVPQMEAELFAQPVTETSSSGSSVTRDFKGDRSYNIMLLACNRKRDGLGNNIEKAITATYKFGSDLPVKSVKGHYRFLGLAPGLRYGYQIRREKGVWKITVPTDLVLPKSKMTDMIDIPEELAIELGLDKAGKECDPKGTKFRDNDPAKEVLSGYIRDTDSGDAGKRNGARYAPACRVKRSLKGSTSWSGGAKDMTVLLKRFWQKRIKDVWNRPGFEVEPILLDLDKPSQADVNAWEKDELVWRPQLNLITYHRPTYKQWTFKFWTQIYSGVPTDVFTHEFGHQMGLDDEYNEKNVPDECKAYIGSTYLMCDASGFDQARVGAKGLYAWVVTRRYAAADAPQCKENSDCGSGFVCAKNGLNRNVCEEKRSICSSCSADDQCASGLECIGKPAGHCAKRGSVDVGDGCCANDQCKSGKCDSDNICQCTKDGDCGSGHFCAENGLNDNVCESYRAVCSTCGSDSQCGPGAKCKGTIGFQKCIVEDTLSIGARCCMDAQCKSGKCEKDACVCRKDTDCPGGKKCKTPITGQNYCE